MVPCGAGHRRLTGDPRGRRPAAASAPPGSLSVLAFVVILAVGAGLRLWHLEYLRPGSGMRLSTTGSR